jgi:flagellar basal body rod protein FlgB
MPERKAGKTMIDPDRDTAFSRQILDVLSARTKASLHNVANQHVEGFKRYTVRFEDLVREATARGREASSVAPVTERDESGEPGQNNVVLMEELAILGKTALLHDVMTRRVGSYFQTVSKAIQGR